MGNLTQYSDSDHLKVIPSLSVGLYSVKVEKTSKRRPRLHLGGSTPMLILVSCPHLFMFL